MEEEGVGCCSEPAGVCVGAAAMEEAGLLLVQDVVGDGATEGAGVRVSSSNGMVALKKSL